MRTQNTFSRVSGNDMRMGAFYTDPEHCRYLANYFSFCKEEETTVLEPSIGDGTAVELVTKVKENSNVKIFGVELNGGVAKTTNEKETIEACIEADFLDGVRIKNNAFAFCFGNPPYINDDLGEERERTEKQFLEKVTNYLIKEGLLCWVIPYHVFIERFIERSHFRYLIGHYDILNVLRFRDAEYAKYKQVAIIARKRQPRVLLKDEVDREISKYSLEQIPVLSEKPLNIYTVPALPKETVTLFCCKKFNVDEAYETLHTQMANVDVLSDLHKYINKNLTTKKFVVNNLGKPPIPLKKDSLYLLATSGSGQGITGSEETKDLHLQRGVAEVIQESEFYTDESGKEMEKVTSRTKVTMTVVENSGKITVLE